MQPPAAAERTPSTPQPTRLAPFAVLTVVAVALVGSIVGMNALVLSNLREQTLIGAERSAGRRSITLAEQAERAIHSVDLILDRLEEIIRDAGANDEQSFRSLMGSYPSYVSLKEKLSGLPQLEALSVVASNGAMINSSRYWPPFTVNVAHREYFKTISADGAPKKMISEPIQRRDDGSWTVLLVRRMSSPDNKFIGLLLGELSLPYFEDFYRSLDFGPAHTFVLFRNDGVLLLRYPAAPVVGQSYAADLQRTLGGRTHGTMRATSPIDGVSRIWSAHALKGNPLVVVASQTTESALAGWRAISKFFLIITAATAVIILGAAFAIGQWWTEQNEAGRARTEKAEAAKARALAEAALLREREQAAEAASRAKSAFLATMSHEIRTPMNALIGLTSTLIESNLDPDQRASVAAMHDAGNNLLRILNDVLDFSKLEAGRLAFEQTPFSPATLVDNAVSIIGPDAAAKGLALRCESDPTLPPVLIGDGGRIRQVLINLLANAVKFTSRGEVFVAARCLSRDHERVTVEWRVRDTGMGIAADRLPLLFADFVQADHSIQRRFGGTGLGLAICKRIVEQMGGEIAAESVAGEGSTFRFRLTLPWADALKLEQRADRGAIAELKERIAALGRPLRLLIAEDNPTNQLVAMQMLKEFNIETTIASDGRQAIEAAARRDFDLIFMDVRMPEIDGIEATRAIRALGGALAAIPIIAVTANAYPDDMKTCRDAGMTGFVAKPVRKQTLVECIVGALLSGPGAERRTARSGLASASAARKRASVDALSAAATAAPGAGSDAAPGAGASPEAGAGPDEAISRAQLEELADEIGFDSACLALKVFVVETEARLARLRALSPAGAKAREIIRAEAHALKGAAGTLGLPQIRALAFDLEQAAPMIAPADYEAALDSIAAAFARALTELPTEYAAAA